MFLFGWFVVCLSWLVLFVCLGLRIKPDPNLKTQPSPPSAADLSGYMLGTWTDRNPHPGVPNKGQALAAVCWSVTGGNDSNYLQVLEKPVLFLEVSGKSSLPLAQIWDMYVAVYVAMCVALTVLCVLTAIFCRYPPQCLDYRHTALCLTYMFVILPCNHDSDQRDSPVDTRNVNIHSPIASRFCVRGCYHSCSLQDSMRRLLSCSSKSRGAEAVD